ncbi:hypothetical protein [Hyphococcus sp.]|uniref:hypothetical protein n=1 Tax=Hyphococcus sp. TaxID=2038636 RepID=UPI0035C6E3E2
MSNRTIYMSIIAFAAAGALNANTNAHAEEPGYATLSQLIQEDLDAEQDAFAVALTERTAAKINARMEKIDNVFGPLVAAGEAPETIVEKTREETAEDLQSTVLASADFEIAKDAANIENPFNPRLPMPSASIAFTFTGEER